jgi:hypothetical protein
MNHHTRATHKKKERQDESNDAIESWLQLPEPVTHTARR